MDNNNSVSIPHIEGEKNLMIPTNTLKLAPIVFLLVASLTVLSVDAEAQADWGLHVQQLLEAHAEQQFGIKPLTESALGPYNGMDNTQSVIAAKGLKVSVVSNATNPLAD